MSAQGWIGRALRIGLDGEVLAAVRAKSVRYSNTPIDITDGERNGYRRLAEVGDVRSIEVSVDGVTTLDNWPVLRALIDAEEFAALTIENPDGSTVTSDAVIGGLARTGEHNGAVTFSATFQLSGVLEDGDYLTSEIYAPPVDAPVPPVLSASQAGAGDPVELEWTAATMAGGVQFYEVYVSVNGGGRILLDTVDPDVFTFSDTDAGNNYVDGDELTYTVDAFNDTIGNITSNEVLIEYQAAAPFGAVTIEAEWDSVAGIKGLYTEDESPPLTYLLGSVVSSTITPTVKAMGTLYNSGGSNPAGFLLQLIHTEALPQDYFRSLTIPGIATLRSNAFVDDYSTADVGGGNWLTLWQWQAVAVDAEMVNGVEYTGSFA